MAQPQQQFQPQVQQQQFQGEMVPVPHRSPRRTQTPEQTKFNREQKLATYRFPKLRDYYKVSQRLAQTFSDVTFFLGIFTGSNKFATLEYVVDDKVVQINGRQIKASKNSYKQAIKDLRWFFAAAKTKPRKAKPLVGSFSGVYSPYVALGPLATFLAQGNFGAVDPLAAQSQALADFIPTARRGYLLKNTLTMLIYVYVYANGLNRGQPNGQLIAADQTIVNLFKGTVPAALNYQEFAKPTGTGLRFVKIANGSGENSIDISERRRKKIYDEDARLGKLKRDSKGLVKQYNFFNQGAFRTQLFQAFISFNYANAELANRLGMADAVAQLNDPNTRAAMAQEHETVKATLARWAIANQGIKAQRKEANKAEKERKRKETAALKKAEKQQHAMEVLNQISNKRSPARATRTRNTGVPGTPGMVGTPGIAPQAPVMTGTPSQAPYSTPYTPTFYMTGR